VGMEGRDTFEQEESRQLANWLFEE
jgi:hypothetical protein